MRYITVHSTLPNPNIKVCFEVDDNRDIVSVTVSSALEEENFSVNLNNKNGVLSPIPNDILNLSKIFLAQHGAGAENFAKSLIFHSIFNINFAEMNQEGIVLESPKFQVDWSNGGCLTISGQVDPNFDQYDAQ